jgi:hypothetical protein
MQSIQGSSGAFAPPQRKFENPPAKTTKTVNRKTDSKHAVEEIRAYITIRDSLLEEAEKLKSIEALRRVSIANDFVETCLSPPRPPYEAQFLLEADAVRERERCQVVKIRIAEIDAQKV